MRGIWDRVLRCGTRRFGIEGGRGMEIQPIALVLEGIGRQGEATVEVGTIDVVPSYRKSLSI
jgi:hypothetical protein